MPKMAAVFILLLFISAACAPTSSSVSTLVPTTLPPTAEPESPTPAATTAPVEAAQVLDRPAWFSLPLTDARTGETFTLGDFSGQLVFVEPMATWCANCRAPAVEQSQHRLYRAER